MSRLPVEFLVLLYFLSYAPYAVVTRLLTSEPAGALDRTLTGLETLPIALVVSGVMVIAFVWLSGWWRRARKFKFLGLTLPGADIYTFMAGVGAAMLLLTVPLSYTFEGVSIPFVQLLMRGDVLIMAPLVDLLMGRKVRWYSWVALVLVLIGLAVTVSARGGFHLPPLLIGIIIIYTIGYFIRLAVMTKIAKNENEESLQRYFAEEKIVATPISIFGLAAIAFLFVSPQSRELEWGFTHAWTSEALPLLLIQAGLLFILTIVSALILLGARENTYCVPLERAGSVLAGVAAAYVLAIFYGLAYPTVPELIGAALLAIAVVTLSLGARLDADSKKKFPAAVATGDAAP